MVTTNNYAPTIRLPNDRTEYFELENALEKGVILLTFVKPNCPTCQLLMPILDRFHEAFHKRITIQVISQGDKAETDRLMVKPKNLTVPVAYDQKPYPVSTQYRIKITPTLFLINQSGEIVTKTENFNKTDIGILWEMLTTGSPVELDSPFPQGKSYPDFKKG